MSNPEHMPHEWEVFSLRPITVEIVYNDICGIFESQMRPRYDCQPKYSHWAARDQLSGRLIANGTLL
jgi:hypothetical protein